MNSKASRTGSDPGVGRQAEREQLFVQTLNHMRHDWMNDIQVLYGYLKLKNMIK